MLNFCDSPAFKEHPLYKDEPTSLQIQLYYDDVEVVNPLGANTKVHKLGRHTILAVNCIHPWEW